jgi:serine/threonine-protein kinase
MDPPPSSLVTALQDRYRLERELGHGGMATVYLGYDLKHDRPVAVKVLRPELSGLLGRERFLREIEIAARLQHPNILPLFDSGSACDFLYYVMPYVEGESLRDLLDREKQLALDDTLAIAREVADALAYAHGHGVVHRDIKPGNILLSGGHALVADFGIARAIRAAGSSELTTRGIAVGTPHYMSPEQSSGQDDVDARSDLYSLGCVVYEMLAGEPPFTGRTAQAIAARHLQEPPPSLRVVRPSLPPEVQQVIETALAKVRAERYPTVGRFVAALEAARTAGPGEKRRLKVGVTAVAATAVLVGGVLWRFGISDGAMLDGNKVVVFPLAEIPASQRMGAGEAIAVMIESALEHTEPLRWIDGWQQLNPDQRADPAQVTDPAARRIARDRGARWYTTGTAVHRGDSTTVVLRLNDAQGDSIVSQASATALSTQAPQAGLRAVNELLGPILAPGQQIDLTSLGDRRPGAVAAWLQGEREYRRGNFDSALVHLRRAVAEDSALALAALRGAQASSWKGLLAEAEGFADAALANVALLSGRQAEFTRGLAHYLDGRADSAAYWLTHALARTPDWPEAHMALGEVYHHLMPRADASLDSLARSEFTRAAADTGFAPPLFHLAEIGIRRGELGLAERAADRFRSMGGGVEEHRELDLMLSCARPGREGLEWATAARESPMALLSAAKLLSVAGAFPACVEDASRALLAHTFDESLHQSAFLLLQSLWAAQGRDSAIVALVDSATAAGWWQESSALYPINALAGLPKFDAKVTEGIAALRQTYGPAYEDSLDGSRLLLLGAWYARRGRVADGARLRERLSRRAESTRDPEARLQYDALSAHLLLARGDSAAALDALQRLTPIARRDFLVWGHTESLPFERLVRAELLFSLGRYQTAIEVADGFDHPTPIVYLPFLPASLALRYRAAQALAQPERAARYRNRLAALDRTGLLGQLIVSSTLEDS